MSEPVEIAQQTKYVSFETAEGLVGFRYTTLKNFRWEAHGGVRDPQAIHFFFESGTASVVGGDLRKLVPLIHQERLVSFRVGRSENPEIPEVSFIRIVMAEEKKRFESSERS